MTSTSALQHLYLSAIRSALGIEAHIDAEGDITFNVPLQGTFYVMLDAQNDPEYFMLVFPNFFKVDLNNYSAALSALNMVNNSHKAVKLSFREKQFAGNVKASVEMFIAAPNEMPDATLLGHVLHRALGAIASGTKAFSHAMSTAHPDHPTTIAPTQW